MCVVEFVFGTTILRLNAKYRPDIYHIWSFFMLFY